MRSRPVAPAGFGEGSMDPSGRRAVPALGSLVCGCTGQTPLAAPVPTPTAPPAGPNVVVTTAPRVVDGADNRVVRKHDYVQLRLKQGREFKSQARIIDAALAFKDAHTQARLILAFIVAERQRGTF